MLEIEGATLQDVEIGVVQAHRTGRILRPHQRQQVVGGTIVLQVRKDEFLRGLTILRVDAHGTEQQVILGETDDVAADAAPEERQAGGLPLIFLPDERTPHLERGIHATEEVTLEFEKR